MADLPNGFRSQFISNDGMDLHVVHNKQPDDARPAIVFLHGFPEFWIAWREIFVDLAEDYLIIAPDQRGFNLSDAPIGKENYQTKFMVSDLLSIADQLVGATTFILAGHDWGASVAYAAAIGNPTRISKLIIANGVHPVCFQEALIDDPAQCEASQYFHKLTAKDGAARMGENGFARTFSMFEKFSSSPWLTPAIREEYIEAWSQPERMQAMLHWYGSSPIVVPRPEETVEMPPLYEGSVERFKIICPHLLIWGEKDQALLMSATERLADFSDDLTRKNLPDADHWLLHTHRKEVSKLIADFLK